MQMTKVIGAREIRENLKKADVRLGWKVHRGLTQAGLLLQRLSQQEVPVDFGTLKNSAGTEAIGHGWSTDVVVYYNTVYAVYVHEMTNLQHKPGKKAKYLEGPARENRELLLGVIAGQGASI